MVRVEDGRRVLAVVFAGALVGALTVVSPAVAAPVISGADGQQWNTTPRYTVTPDGAGPIEWSLDGDPRRNFIARQADPTPIPLSDDPEDWEDREYTLTVRQRSGEDTRTFVIDTAAPPVLTPSGPDSVVSGQSPVFTWVGGEPGARYTWRVDGAGANVLRPAGATLPNATVAPLAAGTYQFLVSQTDLAGNTGQEGSAIFTVTPVPPPVTPAAVAPPVAPLTPALPLPRPPATITIKLPSSHSGRLSPRRAAVVRTVRPMLRWRGAPKGTTLYNVQIFRVDTRRAATSNAVALRKLRSVFPRTNRLRSPRLKRGACYVWRVWPYRNADFTKRPLGVSNFCVAKARRSPKR